MSSAATTISEERDVPRPPKNRFDRYFKISERGSTIQREIRGGLATFFTMAYIVVLNPLIVGTAKDVTGAYVGGVNDPGVSIGLVAAATALVAGVMTILMGVVGRYPFAVATGLGLNAFVAVTLASGMTWADAMGLVVLEGLIITVLVLTGFRTAVFRAIPAQLKTAISVGIGLFIALIGFVDAGFVRRIPDEANTTVPLQLGVGGNLQGWPVLVFVLGLLFTAILVARRVKGAILLGIAGTTVLAIAVEAVFHPGPSVPKPGEFNPKGWSLVVPQVPEKLFELPDLSLLGQFSLLGSFSRVGAVAAVLFVFTLMLADFFDTMGTVVGVGAEAGLLDKEGQLPGVERVLLVDSLAAAAGGAASTSSNTTYIESAAGVGEGARTGFASVVTGGLFLLAMFFTPLVQVVPFEAATPALVVVGFLMITQIRNIDFTDYAIAIPAFLTMVVMPFTYSITNGIGAGFVSYAAIKLAQRRAREVHPLLWVVAALFVVYFAIAPIEELLGVK
ncbi:NCS2 family permease [Carbonactinospora thermoautotrophica]|uniref:Xanthine/uracil/vitamin C permease n=1 Tax=Carbonactinospora thermoautotrophica TaxID=1469144 RepID=A0A132MYE2_9ACTN|nr:NCS2 family permease [Carbonactinospora thermoautotrophica]KWX02889.1 Xanthine/uracil/vitamin C permease [Carbonactinospora thermoautotrophica]MCX9192686.1 NCS2 family permease [Carbonactinospora thermoautotrophica]